MDKQQEVITDLLSGNFLYIVIETKFTKHHIERTTYTDRGKIKWIAETKHEAFEVMEKDDEARRSHIDGNDLFPRLYFLGNSFINEFGEWLTSRSLLPTSIRHGEI